MTRDRTPARQTGLFSAAEERPAAPVAVYPARWVFRYPARWAIRAQYGYRGAVAVSPSAVVSPSKEGP